MQQTEVIVVDVACRSFWFWATHIPKQLTPSKFFLHHIIHISWFVVATVTTNREGLEYNWDFGGSVFTQQQCIFSFVPCLMMNLVQEKSSSICFCILTGGRTSSCQLW